MSRGRGRFVRILALIFLVLGVHRTLTLVLPLVAPEYMVMSLQWDANGVHFGADPYSILPAEVRTQIEPDAAARTRFAVRMADGGLRWRLFLLELVGRIPELALMYCMGIALWRSSRPGPDMGLPALPWLTRAAAAGVALALLTPLVDAARTGLLMKGVILRERFYLYVDLDVVERHLLFAAAAWVACWTIAAGLRARQELTEIL